jgi:hypothetical protein
MSASYAPPQIFSAGRDGIDPIVHTQVHHTLVDLPSTMWSYENCKLVFDHPHTLRTTTLGQESYIYSYIKLLPGMYVCTVRSAPTANCRLEIIHREKDGDDDDSNNWQNRIVRRHGCLCANTTDLKILNTGDTDVELRIIFDPHQDLRVPSFLKMEVRSRQRVAMPLKGKIRSGLYKPHPLRYGAMDIHKILKKINHVIRWLETLDDHINQLLRLIMDPLWDMDDALSAFEYTSIAQEIQNALSTQLPHTFLASSYCFSVFLFPGVKIPLMSNTLVTELTACIGTTQMHIGKMVDVLRHSLKYINFMNVDYIEFKQCVSDKLLALKSTTERDWNVVRIDVDL